MRARGAHRDVTQGDQTVLAAGGITDAELDARPRADECVGARDRAPSGRQRDDLGRPPAPAAGRGPAQCSAATTKRTCARTPLRYAERPIEPPWTPIARRQTPPRPKARRMTESDWQRAAPTPTRPLLRRRPGYEIYAAHAHDHAAQIDGALSRRPLHGRPREARVRGAIGGGPDVHCHSSAPHPALSPEEEGTLLTMAVRIFTAGV